MVVHAAPQFDRQSLAAYRKHVEDDMAFARRDRNSAGDVDAQSSGAAAIELETLGVLPRTTIAEALALIDQLKEAGSEFATNDALREIAELAADLRGHKSRSDTMTTPASLTRFTIPVATRSQMNSAESYGAPQPQLNCITNLSRKDVKARTPSRVRGGARGFRKRRSSAGSTATYCRGCGRGLFRALLTRAPYGRGRPRS